MNVMDLLKADANSDDILLSCNKYFRLFVLKITCLVGLPTYLLKSTASECNEFLVRYALQQQSILIALV